MAPPTSTRLLPPTRELGVSAQGEGLELVSVHIPLEAEPGTPHKPATVSAEAVVTARQDDTAVGSSNASAVPVAAVGEQRVSAEDDGGSSGTSAECSSDDGAGAVEGGRRTAADLSDEGARTSRRSTAVSGDRRSSVLTDADLSDEEDARASRRSTSASGVRRSSFLKDADFSDDDEVAA